MQSQAFDREEGMSEASAHSPLNLRAVGLANFPNQSWLDDPAVVVVKTAHQQVRLISGQASITGWVWMQRMCLSWSK